MKINIWKDPKKDKYYFAIQWKDATLCAIAADFFGPPYAIELLLDAIRKGSEFIEKGEKNDS